MMTTENDARSAQQRYNALADSILEMCNIYPSDKNVPVFVTVGSRIHSMLCALNNGKAFVQHTMILDSKISVHLDQTLHQDAIVVHGIYGHDTPLGDALVPSTTSTARVSSVQNNDEAPAEQLACQGTGCGKQQMLFVGRNVQEVYAHCGRCNVFNTGKSKHLVVRRVTGTVQG
jgi:hypothetical protein